MVVIDGFMEHILHGAQHFFNDLPGEVAAVFMMKATHHAVKTAHGWHLIDRVRRVKIKLHTDEHVSIEEVEVHRFIKK